MFLFPKKRMLLYMDTLTLFWKKTKNIWDSFYSIKGWLAFFATFDISADSSVLFSMIFSKMWRTMAPRPNNKVFTCV